MWVRIYEEDIGDVEVGSRIRVNGAETTLTWHRDYPNSGFHTLDPCPYENWGGSSSRIFSEDDWHHPSNEVYLWRA